MAKNKEKKDRQANEKERTHFCPYGFFPFET